MILLPMNKIQNEIFLEHATISFSVWVRGELRRTLESVNCRLSSTSFQILNCNANCTILTMGWLLANSGIRGKTKSGS